MKNACRQSSRARLTLFCSWTTPGCASAGCGTRTPARGTAGRRTSARIERATGSRSVSYKYCRTIYHRHSVNICLSITITIAITIAISMAIAIAIVAIAIATGVSSQYNGFATAIDCTLTVVPFGFCFFQVMPLFRISLWLLSSIRSLHFFQGFRQI